MPWVQCKYEDLFRTLMIAKILVLILPILMAINYVQHVRGNAEIKVLWGLIC